MFKAEIFNNLLNEVYKKEEEKNLLESSLITTLFLYDKVGQARMTCLLL